MAVFGGDLVDDAERGVQAAPAVHAKAGYFRLDDLELSQAECFAIDQLGFLIFCAAHRLANSGQLPKTIHGLEGEQLEIIRAEAVNLSANALMSAARELLPIDVFVLGGTSTFRLCSHRRPPELAET